MRQIEITVREYGKTPDRDYGMARRLTPEEVQKMPDDWLKHLVGELSRALDDRIRADQERTTAPREPNGCKLSDACWPQERAAYENKRAGQ